MEDKYKYEREYVQKLIRNGEHQYLDFKFAVSDSRKIARSLVSFANSGGGTLLIGVKDNGKIAGIRSEEEIYMIDAASALYTKPNVKYNLRLWQIDDKKQVLEVIVKSDKTNVYFAKDESDKWKAYLRFYDNDVVAGNVWELTQKKLLDQNNTGIVFTKDDLLLYSYLSAGNKYSLNDIIKLTSKSETFLADKISDFIILGLIEIQLGKSEIIFKVTDKTIEL